MGGVRSEVGETTTRVLMEAATWDGPNIHRSSWALGLRSEASARFEKGLAPEQCMHAQTLAARLMIELCGATLLPGTIDVGEWAARASSPGGAIRLREDRVRAILGVPVSRARQREILHALDFHTEEAADGLDVAVPAVRRADVTREVDLIEEVARIDGLEKLPAALPRHRPAGLLSPAQRLRRRAVDALVGRGLYETVGWTFTSREALERLRLSEEDPRLVDAVALENPLSEEHALLRTTLLGSLLDSATRNAARESQDLRIFEVGTVFRRPATASPTRGHTTPDASRDRSSHPPIDEHRALGVLLSGRTAPVTWRAPEPPRADLYAVKGVLEALAAALRATVECRPAAGHPFLHPGRAAEVVLAGETIGWLGELHPLVAERELAGAGVMELDLDRLIAAALAGADRSQSGRRQYRDLVSFPALRQDLAVVLPERVPAAAAVELVRETAGELLDDVQVFDVYTGPQVGEGRRSLALALSFRAPDRTLAEQDVAPVRERIVAALGERLGGELRG
jgi:phenylalanyl-tRNA synthetase beta chain